MTDNEIRASIRSVIGFPADLIPNAMEIAIYRAGMREAAKIARGQVSLRTAVIAMERAAGGEG